MPFASQGRIFLEVLFSRASREGKQGCGKPYPWRLATRHCVYSVMHLCMTFFYIALLWHSVMNDLARRSWQGRALPWRIVLSFAPSAAAVWHCDRERITCERNSARHSVCFKRLVRQFVRRFLSIVALGGTPGNLKIHPGPPKSTFCNPAGRHRPKL